MAGYVVLRNAAVMWRLVWYIVYLPAASECLPGENLSVKYLRRIYFLNCVHNIEIALVTHCESDSVLHYI